MSEFSQECQSYLDEDGLIGSRPNPPKWSTGNALLETSIACVIDATRYGRSCDTEFLKARQAAIASCRSSNGLFDKNPGRPDQITHDDLIGVACASRIVGMPFARDIASFGKSNHWVMSNTGALYAEAIARPWDIALYKLCAYGKCSRIESTLLSASIAFSAEYGSSSDNRLIWLKATAIEDLSRCVLAASFRYWRRVMRARYATVGSLMLEYYKDAMHPFVVYGRTIGF